MKTDRFEFFNTIVKKTLTFARFSFKAQLKIETLWLYNRNKKCLEISPVNKCFNLFFNLVLKSSQVYQESSCSNNYVASY